MTKSLIDVMVDGREYESIIGYTVVEFDGRSQIRRLLTEIESASGRPVLCYAANMVRPEGHITSIDASDELPFYEMVNAVAADVRSVDVLVVTPGGSANQVSRFVDKLRSRFDEISFIIPDKAMSAGTLWALSGNEIWMRPEACLGPIDPQVPDRDGRFLPAQAILTLIDVIQELGAKAIAQKSQPLWTHIRLLDKMDPKEIGNAMAMSQYAIDLAAAYLEKYKFRDWSTPEARKARALEVANGLCAHQRWKVHGHALSRETLWNDLRIRIRHTEEKPDLDRAVRRLWALLYWLFDSMPLSKLFISQHYSLFRALRTPNAAA